MRRAVKVWQGLVLIGVVAAFVRWRWLRGGLIILILWWGTLPDR